MHESFIFQKYFDDLTICDALIEHHTNATNKVPGRTYKDDRLVVDKTVKDSEDLLLSGQIAEQYSAQLQKISNAYIAKYPQCALGGPWGLVYAAQVQKYPVGGAYFQWHYERTAAQPMNVCTRHLVFMTYLNDVTDGGETEFQLQGVKIQPRKGLTLIWPADWTHTHRGAPSPTQEKYIVTGWFDFM